MLFWTWTSRRSLLHRLTHLASHLRPTNSAISLKQFQTTAFSLVSVLIVPKNIWDQLRYGIFEKIKKTSNKAMVMNVYFELLRKLCGIHIPLYTWYGHLLLFWFSRTPSPVIQFDCKWACLLRWGVIIHKQDSLQQTAKLKTKQRQS